MRIVLALLLTLATHAGAAELWGRVVSLADGDTLTVLDGDRVLHTVRLAGIDSPERRQAFGNVSRQHLAGLFFDRDVTVEWLPARAPGPRVCPISKSTLWRRAQERAFPAPVKLSSHVTA
jgi:endonuclease YncB( thermonuclease family)